MKLNWKRTAATILASVLVISGISSSGMRKADAAPASQGLGVAYHTQEEIISYLTEQGGLFTDAVTYSTEPSATAPYAAGALSEDTLNSGLAMMNQIRYIAGLPEVSLDAEYTEKAQAAAMLMAANDDLSHSPARPAGISDELYALGKSGAGSSNIAWGLKNLNIAINFGWMEDSDELNIPMMGHRRWILNPKMGKTGFGECDYYYAMYSFDNSNASDITGVTWPAQQMPVEYFRNYFGWSYSYGKRIMGDVAVELTRLNDGEKWTFSDESADGEFYVDNMNFGQPGCVIFLPEGIHYEAGDRYQVKITGLDEPVEYTVEFFSVGMLGHIHRYSFTTNWQNDYHDFSALVDCSCGFHEEVPGTVTIEDDDDDCSTAGSVTHTALYMWEGIQKGAQIIFFNYEMDHEYGEPEFTWDGFYDCTATVSCQNDGCKVSTTVDCEVTEKEFPPTCTEDGEVRMIATAVIDGVEYTDSKHSYVLYAGGHRTGDYEITVEPNCTDSGEAVFRCAVCGEIMETEVLEPWTNVHVPGTWRCTQEPTCTGVGIRSVFCEKCGRELDGEEIEPLGHNYDDWIDVKDATCTEAGYRLRECSRCGYVDREDVPAAGHAWEDGRFIKATCTEDGMWYKQCRTCGIEEIQIYYPAQGHNPGYWNVVKEPTTEEEGMKELRCRACQIVLDSEVIEKLPAEPEETETEPEETVTEPEETVTEPEETVTEPEETVTEPEETVTEPEETVTEPEESVTEPEETVTEPEETVTEPEETVTEPEETVTEPEETVTEPEETVTEPEETVTDPEETVTEPEETPTEPSDTPVKPSLGEDDAAATGDFSYTYYIYLMTLAGAGMGVAYYCRKKREE